jgi:hypothetical protein
MKVKDFNNLKVGDRVRITDKKYGTHWNSDGNMDKWLGKVMTVCGFSRFLGVNRAKMIEDKNEHCGGGWFWYPEMIAKKIESEVKEIKRKAKVGEYIKIVCADPINADYHDGDIFEVKGIGHYFSGTARVSDEDAKRSNAPASDGLYPIVQSEYVVLEGYKPPKKVKEVKRHAKFGEYVKIVAPSLTGGHYKKGDILKVVNEGPEELWSAENYVKCEVSDRPDPYSVFDYEYVVLEGYEPEKKAETKFDKKPTIVEHLVKDRKTIVKLSNGNVGISVCAPEDEFDPCVGLRLAAERAYGKTEPYKKPTQVREVKRKAKVGEYIKIVNPDPFLANYKKGQIFKVINDGGLNIAFVSSTEAKVNTIGLYRDGYPIRYDEYVVLENYKPNKK